MSETASPFWSPHAELAGEYSTHDEWLELRRTGVGSSDCSAIIGLSKYASPFSTWLEKTGRADGVEETEAMLWGTLLEPVIRQELGRRLGVTVVECPTLRSIDRPWQMYNPDGMIPELRALVEIKNASAWLAADWDDQVPDHAELQVQHGMAVTGADGAYVAGLIGGNRLRIEYVGRDDNLIDNVIIPAEHHFWHEYVLANAEPPIDGSDATTDAIKQLWPNLGTTEIADDPMAVLDSIATYQVALEDEKAAKARKSIATNELRAMMRGADILTDADGRKLVALRRGQFAEKAFRDEHPTAAEWLHKVEAVDRDRLKSEAPELYRQYQSTSIYVPKGK